MIYNNVPFIHKLLKTILQRHLSVISVIERKPSNSVPRAEQELHWHV